jgi:hypothetical protein
VRVFQNNSLYNAYFPRIRQLDRMAESFNEAVRIFLHDRFAASHILEPVLSNDSNAFFTNGNDPHLQQRWANERGLPKKTPLDKVLLAQIEDHKTEVFYNLDPVRFDSAFVRNLPGSVRTSIGWRAAPLSGADVSAYDLIVSNFPGILSRWHDVGVRTAAFFPAHDPVMDEYVRGPSDREIDVIFVGGYSRHHVRRAGILEKVAALHPAWRIVFKLDRSRFTRLAEFPLGGLSSALARHRRPSAIRAVSELPVFGRDLYASLGNSKIVINCAIDMAGEERGNMRCFEALGAGALLVSDNGTYPTGMHPGRTLQTYSDGDHASALIETALTNWESSSGIALAGSRMVRDMYSKRRQWERFLELV